MIMSDGDSGFQRGRREAREGREEVQRRARIEAEDARATRDRLERGSPSAPRRSLVNILNGMVTQDAASEMAGLDAILGIRKAQRLGYRTAADHNRAHELASAPVGRERDDARDDRIGPDLAEARRLLDAAGSLIADARTASGHWASGEATGIRAEFLLDAAIALINAVNARARLAA